MDVVCELRLQFKESSARVDHSTCSSTFAKQQPVPVVGQAVDMVAAICDRVEELAILNCLSRESIAVCIKYTDIFPADILHITHLPNNIIHSFKLKNPNLVISRCRYECPKRY